MIKTIIFDLDGTLVDCKELHRAAFRRAVNYCNNDFEEPTKNNKWSFVKHANSKVIQVAEKEPISTTASVGYYYWKNASDMFESFDMMFSNNDRVNGEFYVCPSFNYLLKTVEISPFWVDTMYGLGTPEDYLFFKSQTNS
jgi:UDP-N-acetylglucosamine diphosphorylase / glucose-1-phosphate thymidylyltransferase / UDP-N-acetylgalactosamine diphosphorylase / glucosamine-1-phosphate N-acetyltransferase / galactosamine-1-phosphate N-acetyltransferase